MLSIWAMPSPSSGRFVMTKSVHQHKIIKGGNLQESESPLMCVVIAEGSTNALPVSISILAHFCIPVSLHNKNVLQCLINVAGHKILLFHCHHSLRFGHTLVLLWCWKRLPSGGWWSARWRLSDIPWQCSKYPCEQEIKRRAGVFPLFHWRKSCVLPMLLFHKALPSQFTESKDVPFVPVGRGRSCGPLHEGIRRSLPPWVSQLWVK